MTLIVENHTKKKKHSFSSIYTAYFESISDLSPGCSIKKPSLHMVVTMSEGTWEDASKKILKLSIYRLQIFLVINTCDHYNDIETKPYLDSSKYTLSNMFAIHTTYNIWRLATLNKRNVMVVTTQHRTRQFIATRRQSKKYVINNKFSQHSGPTFTRKLLRGCLSAGFGESGLVN